MTDRNKRKGFTLAELLVVVAIIAVLVAIAIPIFTSQLEKSREATDAANIRSQYAQVMTDAITDGGNVNGKDVYGAIDLKQKKDDWQDETLGNNLHGLFQEIVGVYPKVGGTAWVEYKASESKVILHYEGEGSNSGSSSGGSTGGSGSGGTSGGNGNSTSFNGSGITIDNVNVLDPDIQKGYSVSSGSVYSYKGNYYVCIADRTVGANWQEYDFINSLPNGNNWPYIQLSNNPTVVTDSNLIRDQYNNIPYFTNLAVGTIYKDANGHLYILKNDCMDGSWIHLPSSNGNWQLIIQ